MLIAKSSDELKYSWIWIDSRTLSMGPALVQFGASINWDPRTWPHGSCTKWLFSHWHYVWSHRRKIICHHISSNAHAVCGKSCTEDSEWCCHSVRKDRPRPTSFDWRSVLMIHPISWTQKLIRIAYFEQLKAMVPMEKSSSTTMLSQPLQDLRGKTAAKWFTFLVQLKKVSLSDFGLFRKPFGQTLTRPLWYYFFLHMNLLSQCNKVLNINTVISLS